MVVTLVLHLLQRRLGCIPGVPLWFAEPAAFLLEVAAAVPAVGFLAEPLARLVMNALSISDGRSEGDKGQVVGLLSVRKAASCKKGEVIDSLQKFSIKSEAPL